MENLDKIADGLRGVLQAALREFVRNKDEREQLAKVLGRTPGHIKQMIYKGEGGLDSWAKAFAYCYKIDLDNLDGLRLNLRKKSSLAESDVLWFAIRDRLGAAESDLLYLARCAHEAYRIKTELDSAPPVRRARRTNRKI